MILIEPDLKDAKFIAKLPMGSIITKIPSISFITAISIASVILIFSLSDDFKKWFSWFNVPKDLFFRRLRLSAGAMAVPQLIGVILQISFRTHSNTGVGPGIYFSSACVIINGSFAIFFSLLRGRDNRDNDKKKLHEPEKGGVVNPGRYEHKRQNNGESEAGPSRNLENIKATAEDGLGGLGLR